MNTYTFYFKTLDGYWKTEIKANNLDEVVDEQHINIPLGSLIIPITEEEFNKTNPQIQIYSEQLSSIMFKDMQIML